MKILIIKLGYSETLDPEIGKVASLGDVLRTTPILWALKERFPDSHISWLVSDHAEPLLRDNHFIDRILVWDEFVPFQLMREKIDVLINLEKIPGVAALADMIDAWTKYGFRFDGDRGTYHTYERGLDFLECIERKRNGQVVGDFWQKILIEMLGVVWRQQPCIIGYQPVSNISYDVGLNYQVGTKWPTKAMPQEKWQKLEVLLNACGYRVSWQQGLGDLYEYMDWINSCRTIISSDSLGLHIAFALGKKAIGLFGPTDGDEVYLYNGSVAMRGSCDCPERPCWRSRCATGLFCMDTISLEEVVEAIQRQLSAGPAD
jgi:heptosyltransferase-2